MWRGFALRKLQSQYSPLVASLIVSFVWIPWHLLMWYLENGALTTAYLVRQFVFGGAIGVTFSWLYNCSEGSILAVGLMHASLNTSVIFMPHTGALDALLIVLAVLVMILDRMWIGHPNDQRDEERHLRARISFSVSMLGEKRYKVSLKNEVGAVNA